jgi:hypothetical protein
VKKVLLPELGAEELDEEKDVFAVPDDKEDEVSVEDKLFLVFRGMKDDTDSCTFADEELAVTEVELEEVDELVEDSNGGRPMLCLSSNEELDEFW